MQPGYRPTEFTADDFAAGTAPCICLTIDGKQRYLPGTFVEWLPDGYNDGGPPEPGPPRHVHMRVDGMGDVYMTAIVDWSKGFAAPDPPALLEWPFREATAADLPKK